MKCVHHCLGVFLLFHIARVTSFNYVSRTSLVNWWKNFMVRHNNPASDHNTWTGKFWSKRDKVPAPCWFAVVTKMQMATVQNDHAPKLLFPPDSLHPSQKLSVE